MTRPEDPPGAKSDLTSESQILPEQMSDQGRQEEIERRRAADAQAMRVAQARINNAIGVIRSFRKQQPNAPAPKLPPAANLRLPQRDAADTTTSSPPPVDHFAGIEARLHSSLDPEIMPPPPEGSRVATILTRSALMVGFAAIVAYGITVFPSFQPGSRSPRMSHEPASNARQLSRLVVEDQQAFANQPILLGVAVTPATASGSLSLGGLANGTRLSAGVALNDDSWQLSLRDIGGAYVYAPPDFVGVMNAMVALLSPSKKVIDSRPMRLEWIAKADSLQPPAKREIDSGPANAVPKLAIDSGTASVVAKREFDTGTVSTAAVKPIDPQEAAALMERGQDLLRNGDIASAQLAFRRLAEAGKADAALALASTYDPRYLAEHKHVGIIGDDAKARAWYQRARELGSIEADRILRRAETK